MPGPRAFLVGEEERREVEYFFRRVNIMFWILSETIFRNQPDSSIKSTVKRL